MLDIFQFIFLPSSGLAFISSVALCLIPVARRKFVKVKMIVDVITIISAILLPVLSGVFLVRWEAQQKVFILLKVSEN